MEARGRSGSDIGVGRGGGAKVEARWGPTLGEGGAKVWEGRAGGGGGNSGNDSGWRRGPGGGADTAAGHGALGAAGDVRAGRAEGARTWATEAAGGGGTEGGEKSKEKEPEPQLVAAERLGGAPTRVERELVPLRSGS